MELSERSDLVASGEESLPEPPRCGTEELPPPDIFNLKLTPAQRAEKLVSFLEMLSQLRDATASWRK